MREREREREREMGISGQRKSDSLREMRGQRKSKRKGKTQSQRRASKDSFHFLQFIDCPPHGLIRKYFHFFSLSEDIFCT
jgi:hypothetical protein